ncbi:hypothetical protein V7149_16015 [Bacillus sp. JJ1503]|uniref:hypothetical protein n=1 Tax=Bacillus sp. JJ1503 TaxID=3122956 RepID=UPI002FFF5539
MEIELRMKVDVCSYSKFVSWKVDIYKYVEENSTEENPGIKIGHAKLNFYDATKNSQYSLRMKANLESSSFSEFECLCSVRIFQDEYDLEAWEMSPEYDDMDKGKLDRMDFESHELSQFNWLVYDRECTENVFGRLVTLEKIWIEPQFRNQGFGRLTLEQIIKDFKLLGMDFILLKPHPLDREVLETEEVRLKEIERLIEFYKKSGFILTKGMLKDEYCMVMELN